MCQKEIQCANARGMLGKQTISTLDTIMYLLKDMVLFSLLKSPTIMCQSESTTKASDSKVVGTLKNLSEDLFL